MARRNTPFQVKKVNQLALVAGLPTHHGKPPLPYPSPRTERPFAKNHEPFFNSIGPGLPHYLTGGVAALSPKAAATVAD